jgi:hypothetical protein
MSMEAVVNTLNIVDAEEKEEELEPQSTPGDSSHFARFRTWEAYVRPIIRCAAVMHKSEGTRRLNT